MFTLRQEKMYADDNDLIIQTNISLMEAPLIGKAGHSNVKMKTQTGPYHLQEYTDSRNITNKKSK